MKFFFQGTFHMCLQVFSQHGAVKTLLRSSTVHVLIPIGFSLRVDIYIFVCVVIKSLLKTL